MKSNNQELNAAVNKIVNKWEKMRVTRMQATYSQDHQRMFTQLLTPVTLIGENGEREEGLLVVKADHLLIVVSARRTSQS
jgi:hypothetical protein